MNIEQAKQISLINFLLWLGYPPVKKSGISLWYNSPFRSEKAPSFKVNTLKNLWYDFGLGKGGTIIDLAKELQGTESISEALLFIDKTVNHSSNTSASFSFRQQKSSDGHLSNITISQLESPLLLDYLRQRGIKGTSFAKLYQADMHVNSRNYVALAFQNNEGGYELRNKYYKGCTSKAVTSILQDPSKPMFVFEGFIDYLSFVDMANRHSEQSKVLISKSSFLVLNSTMMLSKAMKIMQPFVDLRLMLDNDDSGHRSTAIIKSEFHSAVDCSLFYSQSKDLNEFLAKANDNEVVDFLSRCVNVRTETKVSPEIDPLAFSPDGRKRESTSRLTEPIVGSDTKAKTKPLCKQSPKKGRRLCR